MKICAISDLHGYLPKIKECDYLFIAGDIVPLDIQHNYKQSIDWLGYDFKDWILDLPCKKVYLVPGNHDFICEWSSTFMELLSLATNNKLVYMSNATLHNDQLSILGTPLCHKFGNWAFMHDDDTLRLYYNMLDLKASIYITHDTPAIGDLDLLPPSRWSKEPIHAGNKLLAEIIKEYKPRYVFCGHLHTCKDKHIKIGNTDIYNVSLLDNDYNVKYEPLYLDIDNLV